MVEEVMSQNLVMRVHCTEPMHLQILVKRDDYMAGNSTRKAGGVKRVLGVVASISCNLTDYKVDT